MDSKNGEIILDTTKVEQQHKPTTYIDELKVRLQEIDGNRVSGDDDVPTTATESDDATRGDPEEKSSAGLLASSIPAEKDGNSCQLKDSHAPEDISSHTAGAENIHDLTLVEAPRIIVEDTTAALETQPGVEESGEDGERKAFFYISSSSLIGIGDGSEQTSVSSRFPMPVARPVRRIVRQEGGEPVACLGTQRCHYIVLVTALLTALVGCIVYYLSNSGIGPGVLGPIGASTAFISFAVCVFSSIYISYLKSYLQSIPVTSHFELPGDVDSDMIMNRTSDPEFDIKRFAEESGTAYSTQPQKKFKGQGDLQAEIDAPVESVGLTDVVSNGTADGD